jgi:hypothetical protein
MVVAHRMATVKAGGRIGVLLYGFSIHSIKRRVRGLAEMAEVVIDRTRAGTSKMNGALILRRLNSFYE